MSNTEILELLPTNRLVSRVVIYSDRFWCAYEKVMETLSRFCNVADAAFEHKKSLISEMAHSPKKEKEWCSAKNALVENLKNMAACSGALLIAFGKDTPENMAAVCTAFLSTWDPNRYKK